MTTMRVLRLSLLVVGAVSVGAAVKLKLDELAAAQLAESRKLAERSISVDQRLLDRLTADLARDRETVDKLAKEVVPTKREVYLVRPIHAGDSFAGMVGSGGFEFAGDSPFRVRIVPDAAAASKLAAERKLASDKLAADRAAADRATNKLAHDRKVAEKLAQRSARWKDAFASGDVQE